MPRAAHRKVELQLVVCGTRQLVGRMCCSGVGSSLLQGGDELFREGAPAALLSRHLLRRRRPVTRLARPLRVDSVLVFHCCRSRTAGRLMWLHTSRCERVQAVIISNRFKTVASCRLRQSACTRELIYQVFLLLRK